MSRWPPSSARLGSAAGRSGRDLPGEANGCLACRLTNGEVDLPGGRIYGTGHWVVEHCIGPLPVGTLIVKPFRHCVGVWELTDEEATELGPLLRRSASAIRRILTADQVYVCLWSHEDWTPGHLHFVLQPVWDRLQKRYERPGPFLQAELFGAGGHPDRAEIEVFAAEARRVMKAEDSG